MKLKNIGGALVLILFVSAAAAWAQTSRKAVSGSEVTGTFRSYFKGKYKEFYNQIKIQALGGGKLRVEFALVYPKVVNGEFSPNTGVGGGEATITGDTAVFTSTEYGTCKITMKFTKPGTLVVTQEQEDSGCGFGFNVSADGTYRKASNAKPKFDEEVGQRR